MPKFLTPQQVLGEIGEAATRLRFLTIGFQFDGRSRLEAGIDGIAEVMENGRPMARMIAVQVKATESSRYPSENDQGFTYLLNSKDLTYWGPSNLPVIIVLYRKSDETFYWQEVPRGFNDGQRRLQFNKERDSLGSNSVDRLAALTVPKAGFGYYVPPLGGGEEALVNILPITLPPEIFVASTPHSGAKATALLLGLYDPRPLLLCPHASCDSTISQIAEEVFSLTKINWNSTQMNQRLPIPIRAARKVGEVLKYLKDGQIESSDYRRYI